MKIYALAAVFLVTLLSACQSGSKKVALYVGTYSVENSEGIYRYQFDTVTGDLIEENVTPNLENPSFITISPDQKYLYAVSEVDNYNHLDSGSVTAYRIEKDGSLTKLNQVATLGNHPCHVAVSPDGKAVVASNYTSGSISIYEVNNDGSLEDHPQLIQHEGTGPDTVRQQGPHAHSSQFSADGSSLITADLGIDKLLFCVYNSDSAKYVPAEQPFVEMAPGAGPRHFAYTADSEYIYVMTEMASSVSVLKKVGDGYQLIQSESSLPADFTGTKAGADVHLSPDERFVYCSNRGLNSIAVFERNVEDGTVKLIQNESVQGQWPRNFALSPDGKFLLVANQHSDNVTIFSRNEATGLITFTGKSFDIPSPVCLKFLVQ
ncbi:lactonase family protein [Mangrovibacterium lignilyticum]|uniref:lactonase family protein n=1 Tax=Mangrovibacterium lignilyticum TaxID=2668052 RepID=UPI0013D5A1DB|nr:lactonase family protein [Mangrovibacterium lignilyticum]